MCLEIEMADDGSLVDVNPRRMGEVGYYPTARGKTAILKECPELYENLREKPIEDKINIKFDVAMKEEGKEEESKFRTFFSRVDTWDNSEIQARKIVRERYPGLTWEYEDVKSDYFLFKAVATKDQAERSGLDWEKGE